MLQESQLDSRSEIDRLMEQYGSSLLRMSALYLKDSDLAQDAVQETFIKAYRHLNDYRGESSEKTWLTKPLGFAIKAGLIWIRCPKNLPISLFLITPC